MGKNIMSRSAVVVLSLVMLLVGLPLVSLAASEQIVFNDGFENGIGNWKMLGIGVNVEVTKEKAFEGSNSLKFAFRGSDKGLEGRVYLDFAPITAKGMRFRVWNPIRPEEGAIQVKAHIWEAGTNTWYLMKYYSTPENGAAFPFSGDDKAPGAGWVTYEVYFPKEVDTTSPANMSINERPSMKRIQMWVVLPENSPLMGKNKYVYFDNVELIY